MHGGSAGNVRPASLYPLVRGGSTPEMRELAKIGQNVLKDTIPNSGTAERTMMLNLLGLGGAGYVAGSDSMPAWARLAGTGILAGRAMNSPLAARALGQGRPISALARLAQSAPRVAPVPALRGLSASQPVGPTLTEEEAARLMARGVGP